MDELDNLSMSVGSEDESESKDDVGETDLLFVFKEESPSDSFFPFAILLINCNLCTSELIDLDSFRDKECLSRFGKGMIGDSDVEGRLLVL